MRNQWEKAEQILCKELAEVQEQLNKCDSINEQLKKEMYVNKTYIN